MNRRALLKALPAVAAAGIPAVALSGEILPPLNETPIAAMYHRMMQLHREADRIGRSTDEAQALDDQMMELADQIVDLPIRGPMDLIYKIMGHTVNGDHDLGDCPRGKDIWAEARALVA